MKVYSVLWKNFPQSLNEWTAFGWNQSWNLQKPNRQHRFRVNPKIFFAKGLSKMNGFGLHPKFSGSTRNRFPHSNLGFSGSSTVWEFKILNNPIPKTRNAPCDIVPGPLSQTGASSAARSFFLTRYMRQDGITFITAEWIFACVSSTNPHPLTAALRKPACVSSTNPHPSPPLYENQRIPYTQNMWKYP